MNRIFLDANILFSAAYAAGGAVRSLFDVARKRGDSLLATHYVIEEARRNLERKYPAKTSDLEMLLKEVSVVAAAPAELIEELAPLVPDPANAPVLAEAVAGRANILVTGNERDFRALYDTEVRGVLVLRPVDALELLTP